MEEKMKKARQRERTIEPDGHGASHQRGAKGKLFEFLVNRVVSRNSWLE